MTLRAAIGQLIVAGHGPGVAQRIEDAPSVEASPSLTLSGEVADTEWPVRAPIVCTGAAVGLPGTEQVFVDDSFERPHRAA